jgi:hypothetical protein
VTANKHLISLHGALLESVAARTGATLRYEASVGGVIPVLQSLDHGLRTERFTLLVGILNGTTNYILSTMEREGRDFAEALEAARKLGFAEADPSLDLSGADTAQKLTILVRRAFRVSLEHGSIPTEGIVGLELEDLRQADRFGYVAKLLGIAIRTPAGLDLRVHPAFIPKRYLLAAVRDEFNGIYMRGEAAGSMLLYGKGAGALATAQAVLGDVIASARGVDVAEGRGRRWNREAEGPALAKGARRKPIRIGRAMSGFLSMKCARSTTSAFSSRGRSAGGPGAGRQPSVGRGRQRRPGVPGARCAGRGLDHDVDARGEGQGRTRRREGNRRAARGPEGAPRRADLRHMSAWRGVILEYRDLLPPIPDRTVVTLLEGTLRSSPLRRWPERITPRPRSLP